MDRFKARVWLSTVCSLALVMGLATGCHTLPRPVMPIENAALALRLHASLRRPIRSVSTVSRVEQRGPQGRIRGTVWGLIALPDRLRFDVMTSLGPAATLTSDGRDIALLDQREGRYFAGPTCAANVARFLGVALAASDVATLLIGGVPVDGATGSTIETIPGGYDLVIPSSSDGGHVRARLLVRDGDERVEPLQQHLRLARLEVLDSTERLKLVISYDDYRVVADEDDISETPRGVAMPFVVRIDDRASNAELLVRFTEISLNVEIVDDAFVQSPPGRMVVERAECD